MNKNLLLLLISLLLLLSFPLYGMDYSYVTPDRWVNHYTFGGVRMNMEGSSVQDGTLKLSVTARNTLRAYSTKNDNDFYAYLRGQLAGVSLGSGTVSATWNMRAATDTTGRNITPRYNVFYDSLDSSRGDDAWDFRLYQANIVFDDVVKYTRLTAGRFYTDHLSNMQMDGGDLIIGTDDYFGYVYYGVPVSFYKSSLDTSLVGGGAEANPLSWLTLRGEIMKFIDDSSYDADTLYWKLRADADYAFGILDGSFYVGGGKLEDAWIYEYGTYGELLPTGTEYTIWVQGQYENNDGNINHFISDFDFVSGEVSQYTRGGFTLFQGLTAHIAASLGFETQYNYDTYYGDRDYYRYMLGVHFTDLFPGNYISITGEYWDVPADGDYKANRKFYVGGKVSQQITDNLDMWLGASLMSYRYYYRQYDQIPSLSDRENKKLDNSLYLLYAGASWAPKDNIILMLDYMYEHSEVLKDISSSRENISTVALSVSCNF